MARSIAINSFFSRTVANIKTFGKSQFVASAAGGGVLGLANYLKGFAIGTAIAQIPNMIWSFANLWQMFIAGFYRIYTFDWNRPDEELDQEVKARWTSFAGQLGGLVGKSLGFIACGILPSTSMFAFDEKMALYVGERVGEEVLEEIIGEIGFILRQGTDNIVMQGVYHTYKNVRRWLKQDNNLLINQILGNEKAAEIKAAWGEQGSQPFVIANEIEEVVDRIQSPFWRQFTGEAIEEAIEGCFEIGYVVAQSMDQYAIERKNAQRENLRVVEVTPDRSNDDEKLVLAGPENHVKSALVTTVAHHQLLGNRDVGQIIGTDIDDYARNKNLSLRLKLELRSQPRPPFSSTRRNFVRQVTVTVPYVNRTKLDWQLIKFALGGPNGYLWGRFKGRATVEGSNGKEGITIYAATAQEAQDRLDAIRTLSTAEFKAVNITEETRSGARILNPRLYKETTRIYPAYMTVINRERVIALDRGQLSYNGTYRDRSLRFELWRDAPPSNYAELIQESLARSL